MSNKPYIATFKSLSSGKISNLPVSNGSEFHTWFKDNEDIAWAVLINDGTGEQEAFRTRITKPEQSKAPVGAYIKEIESRNTGGWIMMDFVFLKNGKIFGISEEDVASFSLEEVQKHSYYHIEEAGTINLLIEPEKSIDTRGLGPTGISHFIDHVSTFEISDIDNPDYTKKYDVIHLKEGRLLLVDEDLVTMHRNEEELMQWKELEGAGKIDLSVEQEEEEEEDPRIPDEQDDIRPM